MFGPLVGALQLFVIASGFFVLLTLVALGLLVARRRKAGRVVAAFAGIFLALAIFLYLQIWGWTWVGLKIRFA
jgi:drug/metabolite transporter superfamily protein YnfA